MNQISSHMFVKITNSQYEWIKAQFGEEEADKANYGWGSTDHDIATKVYGKGVLTSFLASPRKIEHTFREFGDA